MGRNVVGVGPQPGGDGVAARQVERHVGGDALGHRAGRDAVVDRELLDRPPLPHGSGEVAPGVADVGHVHLGRGDHGHHDRAGSVAAVWRPVRVGVVRHRAGGRVGVGHRRHQVVGAAERLPAQAGHGGVDRGPGRQVGVGADRDAVGHGDHRPALGRDRQGGGVLVAVVAPAPVGGVGQRRPVDDRHRLERPVPARRAVPVGADLAAALVAGRGRGRGELEARVERRVLPGPLGRRARGRAVGGRPARLAEPRPLDQRLAARRAGPGNGRRVGAHRFLTAGSTGGHGRRRRAARGAGPRRGWRRPARAAHPRRPTPARAASR